MQKSTGIIKEVSEMVANNKKALNTYGYIVVKDDVKKPEYNPIVDKSFDPTIQDKTTYNELQSKEHIDNPKMVTIMELPNETEESGFIDPLTGFKIKHTFNDDGSVTISGSSSIKIDVPDGVFKDYENKESEQKLVTVMELPNETVETQTEPKKRGRKAKN